MSRTIPCVVSLFLTASCAEADDAVEAGSVADGADTGTSDAMTEPDDGGDDAMGGDGGDDNSGGPDDDGADTRTGGASVACEYPAGAVDPMALNEVLWPYSWPRAIAADGTQAAIDLADAPCGDDTTIEWSPHDVLVFISIPAW